MMTFEEFKNHAENFKTVPIYERIQADLLTPISAYMKISKNQSYSFLLESVENGSQYSRYSFLGIKPKKIFINQNDQTIIITNNKKKIHNGSFLMLLQETIEKYKIPNIEGLPDFSGGLVGYLGYETIKWFEKIPIHEKNDDSIPDSIFMLYEDLIAFDHLKNQIIVFSNIKIDSKMDLKKQYEIGIDRINFLGTALHNDIDYQSNLEISTNKVNSNFNEKTFTIAVNKIKKYIQSGNIFQLVLSQKFSRKTAASSINIYRALRTINPSPYMFYFKLDNFDIIGASPELLVKVDNKNIQIRPIAGTRPRGKNSEEDMKLSQELLKDKKEKAEHLMLVDLGRNDVGRASDYGTVHVTDYMLIEKYSHVMHIVSNIKGKLSQDKSIIDALFSGFPAGTVTGAPKIRAMEIIFELEPERRKIYSGAIGYLDFKGNLNTCIAIRTLYKKNNTVIFQSGAGIVHDSDPIMEYEETINKSKAILSAIDFAEKGLI